jgi:uncharacterized protein with HEPN domain
MTPPDDVRLQHLREAAEKAVGFSQGKTRQDLDTDELLRLALTKLVEIVGEAAKLVTEETRKQYPEVAWNAAARMRDRLVHHYFDVELDVLWSTVSQDLPDLLRGLRPTEEKP